MDNLLILLFLAAFAMPGAVLWMACCGRDRNAEELVDCVALGTAWALCLLYICAVVSFRYFSAVWLAAALAAAWVALRTKSGMRLAMASEAKVLFGLLLLYVGLRVLPVFFQEFPHGWDAYFHLVLADKIAQEDGLVFDWTPYETASLNYPLGSHVLLALGSATLGVPLHKVFVVAVAFFTALTAAQVYALAFRATSHRELALYAAAAYAFMAVLGSLDYLRWGGLPNLVGMYLFLGLLSLLMRPEWGWDSRLAFGVFFVGLSLAHHHVMLAASASLGWLLLYSVAKKHRSLAARVFQGLIVSGLAGSPYFVSYWVRSPSLQDTGILSFADKVTTPENLAVDLGPIFFACVLLGALMHWFVRPQRSVSPVLLQSLAGLFIAFAAVEYVSRALSLLILGTPIAPFTPSRFVTDMVPFLSVFAGLFLLHLRGIFERTRPFMVGLIVASFGWNLTTYAKAYEPVVPQEKLAAFGWIREHTEPDAIVFDATFAASYLSRRASSHMPYPASESVRTVTVRPLVAEMMKSGKPPAAAGQRRLIHLYAGDASKISASQLLWVHPSGTLAAVELNPLRRPETLGRQP